MNKRTTGGVIRANKKREPEHKGFEMKYVNLTALAAACIAFTFPSQTAKAGDEEAALIGGLLGGLIIGAAIADDNIDASVSVGYHSRPHRSHGYWSWVTVKTWVPGYYERSCDRYGRPRKIWISGYYDFSKKRVWVEGRPGHRHSPPPHYRSKPGHRYPDHHWKERDRGRHNDHGRSSRYARRH